MEIKTILGSLTEDLQSGAITLYQAAEELYNAGWTNYIDTDKTKRLLQLYNKSPGHRLQQ